MTAWDSFFELVQGTMDQQQLVKLTLGSRRNKNDDLKNVFVKPVILKGGNKISFVYRHQTKDITRNLDASEAIDEIKKLLNDSFYNADLFTLTHDHRLLQAMNANSRLISHTANRSASVIQPQHDKQKNRLLQAAGSSYLQQLGISTREGLVKKDMQDKFKQINHYVDIIKDQDFSAGISVMDMGSGKGYLTFALYDYLTNVLQLQASVTGVEMREDLVNTCNRIAADSNFQHLHFIKGTIADTPIPRVDMLIALHACDTATDDAIYKGIQADATLIICAPCCHKQIRKQMKPANILSSITRHGILLERQAEMVTDSIRALLLESQGYKTKVFEFISTAHTPKNVMIAAIKQKSDSPKKEESLEKVKSLKALFNIEEHFLEKLLKS